MEHFKSKKDGEHQLVRFFMTGMGSAGKTTIIRLILGNLFI